MRREGYARNAGRELPEVAAPTALRECISQGTAGDAGLFLLNASNIIKVAGGCDGGFHRNDWGRCVPNWYGYYSRPSGTAY